MTRRHLLKTTGTGFGMIVGIAVVLVGALALWRRRSSV